MEAIVAVLAFAGALLAAIASGALIGRMRSERSGWAGAWGAAAAALCVALAVVAVGHLIGFGPITFRIYQIGGALIAPVWLAIGVVQLLARTTPPKFLTWLWGGAFTFVALVIMVVDPVNNAAKFGTGLPIAAQHWNQPPAYLLIVGHATVVLILVGGLVLSMLRWRNGDEYDADNMHAMLVLAPIGIALVGVVRFQVPGLAAAGLFTVMAAAIWYVVLRPLAPYEDEEDELGPEPESGGWERDRRVAAGRSDPPMPSPVAPHGAPHHGPHPPPDRPPYPAEMPVGAEPGPPGRRRSGLGDLVAEYRAGDREVDYAARMQPRPDDTFGGPATGYIMNQPYDRPNGSPAVSGPIGMPRHGDGGPETGVHARLESTGAHARVESTGAHARVEGGRRARPTPPADQQAGRGPGTGTMYTGGRPAASIYGLLTVFTLLDGAGEAFDKLAEETVEEVRRKEPDSLIFACHAVKQAPLQRIVYELYRDEVAYQEHQRQPHVERFVTERQSLVLATNVIELTVNAAKSAPLPTAYPL